MRILFIRHAEAEEAGHGLPGLDEKRKLTKAGRKQMREMADALEHLRLRPTMILTSPLTRGKETAEVLCSRIRRAPEPVKTPALAPEARWHELRGDILRRTAPPGGRRKKRESVVFAVGHQPHLGEMVAEALAGRPGPVEIKKGGVVGLAWRDEDMTGGAEIFLALSPDMARALLRA
ncbi:MAG: histidine phosphatase family protein [Candidatus Sumerlaeaceae bacterium]|nr:histidine phosphatase family protein [Candidatus Sumerlaeaceae bacterium]